MLMQRAAPPPLVATFDATQAQLALPWTRDPSFRGISPHGLNVSRNPVKFFFQYCGPKDMKPGSFKQTLPMAAGSACDGLLKAALAKNEWHKDRRRYFRGRVNKRTFSVYGTVAKHNHRPMVRERAYDTMRAFYASGLWDHLKDMNLVDLETDKGRATWVHGAPLNGKLDFLFATPGEPKNIVCDLKINGAFTQKGSTPCPGYNMRWDYDIRTGEIIECPAHSKAGFPLEELNWGFAVQLATYALMEAAREQDSPTPELVAPTRTILAQATFKPPSKQPKLRKDGTRREWKNQDGKITITGIDSYVSAEFQLQVLERYRQLWANIQAKTLVPDRIAGWGVDVMFPLATKDHLDDLVL